MALLWRRASLRATIDSHVWLGRKWALKAFLTGSRFELRCGTNRSYRQISNTAFDQTTGSEVSSSKLQGIRPTTTKIPRSSAQIPSTPPLETLDSDTIARDASASLPCLPATIIDTTDALSDMLDTLVEPAAPDQNSSSELYVGEVRLITNRYLRIHKHGGDKTYLVDIDSLGQAAWSKMGRVNEMTLKDLLEDPSIQKVLFDCRHVSHFLFRDFGVGVRAVLDLQVMDTVVRETVSFSGVGNTRRLPSFLKSIITMIMSSNRAELLTYRAFKTLALTFKNRTVEERAPLLLEHRIFHAQAAQYQVQLHHFLSKKIQKTQTGVVAQISRERGLCYRLENFEELMTTQEFMTRLDSVNRGGRISTIHDGTGLSRTKGKKSRDIHKINTQHENQRRSLDGTMTTRPRLDILKNCEQSLRDSVKR